jgi:hypothetical protein
MRCAVRLPETIEDVRQRVVAHSLAGVTHDDCCLCAIAFQPSLDAPASGRVLDGIGEQIPDDLLQADGIRVVRESSSVRILSCVGSRCCASTKAMPVSTADSLRKSKPLRFRDASSDVAACCRMRIE